MGRWQRREEAVELGRGSGRLAGGREGPFVSSAQRLRRTEKSDNRWACYLADSGVMLLGVLT